MASSSEEDFRSEEVLTAIKQLVLTIPTTWMTIDQLRQEVFSARESARQKPPYVPIAILQQIVNGLVTDGDMLGKSDPEKGILYRLNRNRLVARRGAIISALVFEDDNCQLADKLVAKLGCSRVDIEELSVMKLVSSVDGAAGCLVRLGQESVTELIRRGAAALVEEHTPVETLDRASDDSQVKAAAKKVAAAEKRARDAEAENAAIKSFLLNNGVRDIPGIIDAARPKPDRELFDYTETRPVDEPEKVQLFMEVLALEDQKAAIEIRVNGQKALAKSELELINGEIAERKSAVHSSERIVTYKAYKEFDFKANATIIRDARNDRELARQPIPKGTQMPIPGTDKPVQEKPVLPADDGPVLTPPSPEQLAIAAVKVPFPSEPKLAILRASGGVESLTMDALYARIRELYTDVPEDLAGLLKPVVRDLIREKIFTRLPGKKGEERFALSEAAKKNLIDGEGLDTAPGLQADVPAEPTKKEESEPSDEQTEETREEEKPKRARRKNSGDEASL
jgi:hypothetical protein